MAAAEEDRPPRPSSTPLPGTDTRAVGGTLRDGERVNSDTDAPAASFDDLSLESRNTISPREMDSDYPDELQVKRHLASGEVSQRFARQPRHLVARGSTHSFKS